MDITVLCCCCNGYKTWKSEILVDLGQINLRSTTGGYRFTCDLNEKTTTNKQF